MASEEKWYFSKDQLANTPSRKCGYDVDKELSYRQQAANFIQDMGQRLLVTQLCINTAIVYMHRFYVFHSFSHFHRNAMAAASLFLAAKVEEQPRKLEHVIRVAHMCLHRDSQQTLDTKSEQYLEQAHELVFNENVLLQTLGFDVAIDHPHTHVVRCCHMVKASKDLAQTSYFMASNSLHLTTMCLQYKPTVVACFCIHLACKWSNWEIPQSSEGKDWFWYVDKSVSLDQLEQLTQEFLVIFEKCPTKLKRKIMSISATQNAPMPSSLGGSLFDMEPRKVRPTEISAPPEMPNFSATNGDMKQGSTSEDHIKKISHRTADHNQKTEFWEYREKKEREQRIAQATSSRDGHHHIHNHASASGQGSIQSSQVHHKSAILPQHHAKPSSSRDSRREPAISKREMFPPPIRHDIKELHTDTEVTTNSNQVVSESVSSHRKELQTCEWNTEPFVQDQDSAKNGQYGLCSRDSIVFQSSNPTKDNLNVPRPSDRHSQSDIAKRGLNYDIPRHTKVPSDSRSSSGTVQVSRDNRIKEISNKNYASDSLSSSTNTPQKVNQEQIPDVQKHPYSHKPRRPLFSENSSQDSQDKKPDVSRLHYSQSVNYVSTSKSVEFKTDQHSRREESNDQNGFLPNKPPSSIKLSSHHATAEKHDKLTIQKSLPKSPNIQPLRDKSSGALPTNVRSPVVSHVSGKPKSPLTTSNSGSRTPPLPAPNKAKQTLVSSNQSPKIETSATSTRSTSSISTSDDSKRRKLDLPAAVGQISKSDSVSSQSANMSYSKSTSNTNVHKSLSTPEKSSSVHPVRESPYPQRSSKTKTKSSPHHQKISASELAIATSSSPPSSPFKGFSSSSVSTPSSSRHRTSSSSSEPELVPVVTKLDDVTCIKNIMRAGIKITGRVPDVIPPIRDRKKEDISSNSNGSKSASSILVAKEFKPPDIIRPFTSQISDSLTHQTKPNVLGDMGAVAFPSPVQADSISGTGKNTSQLYSFNTSHETHINTQESSQSRTGSSGRAQAVHTNSSVIDVVSVSDSAQPTDKPVVLINTDTSSQEYVNPVVTVVAEESSNRRSSDHHKGNKKQKKEKKHKDKDREDKKHKNKHKNKDKDKHKTEKTELVPGAAPIKITIPKDKLMPTLETVTNPNFGLKLKIQKDRLKGTELSESSSQVGSLKIKISKERIESYKNDSSTSSSLPKETRKREHSSPKSEASNGPPTKVVRVSSSSSSRLASSANSYKHNGVESRNKNYMSSKTVVKSSEAQSSHSKGKSAGN